MPALKSQIDSKKIVDNDEIEKLTPAIEMAEVELFKSTGGYLGASPG
jgi:hypothetical protein